MNAKTPEKKTPSTPPQLAYGGSFNNALCKRLERHFSNAEEDPEGQGKRALVVGLFGEWGCGKTLHLRHIQQHFQYRLDNTNHDSGLTLPVFFNAWRYEAEEHLIIPLLKTTEHQLRQWFDAQTTPTKKALKWVGDGIAKLGDSAVAIGCGIKGKFTVPVVGELEIDPSAMVEEERARQKKRADAKKSYSDDLESLYYNFETEMRRLTGRENGKQKLNFLFLVDDLDRCLPEKAVKMLESIKLFLDVEGCAFVLALDDEVVERGIAHRYRNYGLTHNNRAMESIAHSLSPKRYREFDSGHDHQHANPITGHEYLEKIVQLPVRVPAPSEQQVEIYLKTHFHTLFGDPDQRVEPDHKRDEAMPGRDRTETQRADENETCRLLRKLVEDAVPRVPRKLNRVGELFGLCLDVALKNGWPMRERKEQLTLLRLVILQLLAPDLYRFGRHNPRFLNKLEDWCRKFGKQVNFTLLDKELRDRITKHEGILEALKGEGKPDDPVAVGKLYTLQHLDQKLLELVRVAQQHRSRFHPFNLIDLDQRCDDSIHRYFNLEPSAVTPWSITGNVSLGLGDFTVFAEGTTGAPAVAHAADDRTPAAPSDPEGFFNQLFSGDEIAWHNAIEQEAERLNGHVLDNSSFNALLDRVRRAPQVVSVRWLEQLDPYLSADQLVALYRESKLLQRLNDKIQEEQRHGG